MRNLEELKELAKPTLDHEELIAIARTASSNTEAKNRALVFIKEKGLDEQVAMSCRWLKMLHGRIDQQEFEQFVCMNAKNRRREMVSQRTLSKTEQYNLQLNALCNCADPDVSSCAKAVKDLGFDPTRMEEFFGIPLEVLVPQEPICAHCPMVDNFSFRFNTKSDSPSNHSYDGKLYFKPFDKKGYFTLSIHISRSSLDFSKDFWVDRIDVEKDSVVFTTRTFTGWGWESDPIILKQEVIMHRMDFDFKGNLPYPYIVFRCETDYADSSVAPERFHFQMHSISL